MDITGDTVSRDALELRIDLAEAAQVRRRERRPAPGSIPRLDLAVPQSIGAAQDVAHGTAGGLVDVDEDEHAAPNARAPDRGSPARRTRVGETRPPRRRARMAASSRQAVGPIDRPELLPSRRPNPPRRSLRLASRTVRRPRSPSVRWGSRSL